MKKIIHLSDPHLGYQNLLQRFDILVEQIIQTYQDPENYIIVLTGDIVDNSRSEQDISKAQTYLNKLRLAQFELLIVPGNHDYHLNTLDPADKTQVLAFKKTFLGHTDISYPVKTIINQHITGECIAFIGMDSMDEELKWNKDLSHNGRFGYQQLNRLKDLLESQTIRAADYLVIYFHHHPFGNNEPYTLMDSTKLMDILTNSEKSVDLMLFGHKHDDRNFNGEWGIPRIYNSGSCTLKDETDFSFRVIDLKHSIVELDAQHDFTTMYRDRLVQNKLL